MEFKIKKKSRCAKPSPLFRDMDEGNKFLLHCDPDDKHRWKKEAVANRMSLNTWMCKELNKSFECRNNSNFKIIKAVLKLGNKDIFDMLDGKVTKSKINSWGRSEHASKKATGQRAREKGNNRPEVSRFRRMSDEEFDLFISGVVTWIKENIEEDVEI